MQHVTYLFMFYVLQINPNSKAYNEGVQVGDVIEEINQQKTHGLNYADAQQLIKNATHSLLLLISRYSSNTISIITKPGK